MQGRYFADQAVKLSDVPAFRAEHFPYAGPYPWLDRADALERIEEKLQRGELTAEESVPDRRIQARYRPSNISFSIYRTTLSTTIATPRSLTLCSWKLL